MLSSDFRDTTSLAEWSPDRGGVWSLERGTLRGRLPDKQQARSLIYAGSEAWGEYAVDLDVCQTRGVDKGLALRVQRGRGVGVVLRGPGYHDVPLHLRELPLMSAPVHNDNGIWHHLPSRRSTTATACSWTASWCSTRPTRAARAGRGASGWPPTPAESGAARCTTATWS